MKKIVLPLLLVCLSGANLSAQEAKESSAEKGSEFNKWSVDVNGGFSKASNPMSPGYHVNTFNLFHADLGFRYMFNTKFGLRLNGGYDVLNDGKDSQPFESKLMSFGLQGYANLGRMMEFESWTKRFNVLGHLGVGVSQLKNSDRFDGGDWTGNFIIGLTGQVRLSDRVALTADVTMLNNFSQQHTWDGGELYPNGVGAKQGFDSTLYNASIGFTFYLGKNQQHADWYVDDKSDEMEDAENRLAELETMMNDSDKDGVPDYLDAEPNTIAGVAVDSKGRTIDKNNNGVPDELESYIESKNNEIKQSVSADMKDLVNGGYVNVYFDFNKDQPNPQSVGGINFLVKYLKDNPSATADVIGYADEIGNSEYNKALSQRRAENVKNILVAAGVDGSRLNIIGNGEDASVNKDSKYARQVVRRVTFMLK